MVSTRWPRKRVYRAGFLHGQGLTSDEIAKDPEVQSHPSVVRRYIGQMGYRMDDAPRGNFVCDLPLKAIRVLDAEATKRKRTTESLVARVLIILAEEPHLLSNVLEDEV